MPRPDTRIVPSVVPAELTPRQLAHEFRGWLANGARLLPAGEAKDDPGILLRRGYGPRHRLDLFDARFYLAGPRQNPAIRYFVAYVMLKSSRRQTIHPRIFYKDISLVWRVASHLISTEREFWIGKGDVQIVTQGDEETTFSVESTTDLPLEIQGALEQLNHDATHVPTDNVALYYILRRAPDGRVAPYRDFTAPRRRAMDQLGQRINGGRPVARFLRAGDPTSLKFTPGFEPDFSSGVLEVTHSISKLYGGPLSRYRILSANRRIQYMFFAGPGHVWIIPPQATTTELSTYGVRTVDVPADEDLFVPGFEYHYLDDTADPPTWVSQIPAGYAGAPSEVDTDRADASRWLDRLPVIREFRRKML